MQIASPQRTSHGPLRRRLVQATLALLLLLLTAAPATAQSDPKALEIAARTVDAMGGQEAWDATRFLRFEFFGFRLHHWDRYSGRHRLEGQTRDGDAYVVVHDIKTRLAGNHQGTVWLNGEELDGEAKAEWLERAYGAWINDTYWLIMPYKLRDPGVTLRHLGEVEEDGKVYDKLQLNFDSVGLTPGDTYFAWINRETGLMDRWAYHLEGWEDDREATAWEWRDWQGYGGIRLASTRYNAADDRTAELGKIAVFDHLPDAVFSERDMPSIDRD